MERVTSRPVAYPWRCDAMGHLATQHYMAMFDDALFHFLHEIGANQAADAAAQLGWADVSHRIDYRREVLAGALLAIRSRPLALGRSSVGSQHRLIDLDTGTEHAVLEAKTVRFDLATRRARPIEDSLRATIEAWLAETEDQGA